MIESLVRLYALVLVNNIGNLNSSKSVFLRILNFIKDDRTSCGPSKLWLCLVDMI